MKYGMRERVSGALVLIALAVIFVPLLFDDPAPREERPEPVMTIEKPVDVERRDVEEPIPPEGLDERDSESATTDTETGVAQEPVESVVSANDTASSRQDGAENDAVASDPDQASSGQESNAADQAATGDEPGQDDSSTQREQADDPIAELARAADEREASATQGGEWAVQVGSFRQVSNAGGLQERLEEQGYPAYRSAHDDNLTKVYVGPYGSSEVAEGVMDKLKAGLNLPGFVVRAE